MLQEIIDRIAESGKTLVGKLQGLLFDATIGLCRDYQKKTLELARLTAVSCYLQGAQALRQAAIALFWVTLASVTLSIALVVVPIALVLVAPWGALVKAAVILALGLTDITAAAVFLSHLFSEERWMKITKSQEFIDRVMNPQ